MNDLYLSEETIVVQHLIKEMYAVFWTLDPKDVHFEDRIKVISDTSMFKWKEDESVWKQKKGLSKTMYQCYFDGEHMCTFEEDENLDQIALDYFKTFKEKYQKKMIRLSPKDYKLEQEVKKLDPLKDVKATTKEEKMALEIVKKVQKGKHARPLATATKTNA